MTTARFTTRLLVAGLLALLPAGCSSMDADAAGRTPSLVVTVKFKSEYGADEIRRRYPKRMAEFRALPGLLQKYYLHDPENDEWCGIYLWDSAASVEAYLNSDLRKSIPAAYGVVGTPRVESFQVVDVLR